MWVKLVGGAAGGNVEIRSDSALYVTTTLAVSINDFYALGVRRRA